MTSEPESGGDDRRAIIAEYVLGLLSHSEHERVERLIESSPALQQERDFWQRHFSRLDHEFTDVQPPAHIFSQLENRLFRADARTVAQSFWDNVAVWRALAAGALSVAVIAIGFGLWGPLPDQSPQTQFMVALLDQNEDSDVRFAAFYDGSGNLRLTSLSGSAVPDRDFELWAIQGDAAPVSMGLLSLDETNSVSVPEAMRETWSEGTTLAVTLEPLGGAPGGVPTGPVIAMGATAAI